MAPVSGASCSSRSVIFKLGFSARRAASSCSASLLSVEVLSLRGMQRNSLSTSRTRLLPGSTWPHSPQRLQRAAVMAEMLQQQRGSSSQLGVTQVQALQAVAVPEPCHQGLAAGAGQAAAPQPAEQRGDSSTGDTVVALESLGCAGATFPYRSARSWQPLCWSPSHSSFTPSSRSPALKDRSSSSRHVLVPSATARSWQQALVRWVYRSLRERASAVPVPPCLPAAAGQRDTAALEDAGGHAPTGTRREGGRPGTAHRRTRSWQPGWRSPAQSILTPSSPSAPSPSSKWTRLGSVASSVPSAPLSPSVSPHHCSLQERGTLCPTALQHAGSAATHPVEVHTGAGPYLRLWSELPGCPRAWHSGCRGECSSSCCQLCLGRRDEYGHPVPRFSPRIGKILH